MTTSEHATSTSQTHVVLVPGFWLGAWAWDDVVLTSRPPVSSRTQSPFPGSTTSRPTAAPSPARTTSARCSTWSRRSTGGRARRAQRRRRSGPRGRRPRPHAHPTGRLRRLRTVGRRGLAEPRPPRRRARDPAPSWEDLAADGTSSEGIDDAGLARFRARAVPQPAGVARGRVRVSDPGRSASPRQRSARACPRRC
ncbi:hypothetical protein NKG05_15445 [Oerskovia sp. M15]